jgi:hypothetical protein
MARSSFSKAFNSVDFPTLGSPTMATGIRFDYVSTAKESINLFKTNSILFSNSWNWYDLNSTSPAKSSSSSMSEAKFNSSSLLAISLEKPTHLLHSDLV